MSQLKTNHKVLKFNCVSSLMKLAVSLFVLFLSACASSPEPRVISKPIVRQPVVVKPLPAARPSYVEPDYNDRVIIDGKAQPLPDQPRIAAYSLPQQEAVSPVVRNLVKKSQTQSNEGDFDNAANSLERALRIEPRNAMLWNRLADIRYLQKLWSKSIQLAAKSNTLAGQNRELRRENWYLMSNSYKALGNVEGEQKYRDKLTGSRR